MIAVSESPGSASACPMYPLPTDERRQLLSLPADERRQLLSLEPSISWNLSEKPGNGAGVTYAVSDTEDEQTSGRITLIG